MQANYTRKLPLIPLRGLAVFPYMVLHFDAGREKTVAALEDTMLGTQICFLVSQKDPRKNDLEPEDIHQVGTIARVKQLLKLPGDSIRVLVEGISRARIVAYTQTDPYFEVELIEDEQSAEALDSEMAEALSRKLTEAFEEYGRANGKVSGEVMLSLLTERNISRLTDTIAANVLVNLEDKQAILESFDEIERAEKLLKVIMRETEILKLESRIQQQVKKHIEKSQKEYFLREQIKVIRKELGDDDSPESEADELHDRFEALPLPEEVRTKVEKELKRYAALPGGSHEAPIIRTYLDWILDLPWGKATDVNFDLANARKVLDDDHYGLEKVKSRIIEYLAVCSLKSGSVGTILCLVGPPGVGKTSIASSIARAVGRNFVRMSLGGVRDEAEIRGHRRTYIGAMPGRIITAMKQAESMNPLILFDEIDKMASDFRGDPAAAMLEVLDSAQNTTFRDHYLEVPFDLSGVMFITTANSTDTIPRPLLDRMEIIQLSSYIDDEKVQIAKRHLLPKQIVAHGLPKNALTIPDDALLSIVTQYTREAGVRNLERNIASVCRKVACQVVEEKRKRIKVTTRQLQKLLGAPRYKREALSGKNQVGIVTGLAWTAVGGETLCIEVSTLKGSGKLELTGQLGDVMRESAKAAFSYIRSHAVMLGIDPLFHEKLDIHVHIPEGAIPKDGPSAGISMATAIISALNGIPVLSNVAMTGEITLRGRVLPIGGLKEKSIAALRAGISKIIIPADNKPDLEEIPEFVRSSVKIVFAEEIGTVLEHALLYPPKPLVSSENLLNPMLAEPERTGLIHS